MVKKTKKATEVVIKEVDNGKFKKSLVFLEDLVRAIETSDQFKMEQSALAGRTFLEAEGK